MIFDRNLTEFPTMVHRDIYMRALRLVPPEVSLAAMEKTEPATAASGREFYHFIYELYGDMYCNPESYGMTPGAYEAFAASRNWSHIRLRVKDACAYYDLSEAQITSYMKFIYETALHCHISDGCCYITYDDFESVKDLTRKTPVKTWRLLLPIETVMKNLERVGLHFRDDGSRIQVVHEMHPNLFLSAAALVPCGREYHYKSRLQKLKYYFGDYMDTLEFRLRKVPTTPTSRTRYAHFLTKTANRLSLWTIWQKTYKLRPNYKASQLSFDYKYKGEYVMTVWTNGFFTEPNKKYTSWNRYVRLAYAGR